MRQNTLNQQVVLTFWSIGPFAKGVVGTEFMLDETRRALTERAMCWREGSEKVAKSCGESPRVKYLEELNHQSQ